jgi:hypothetical protein
MKTIILAGMILLGLSAGFVSISFFPHAVQAGPADNCPAQTRTERFGFPGQSLRPCVMADACWHAGVSNTALLDSLDQKYKAV